MRKINVAYSSYNNVKDQPIGLSNARNAKLADVVIKENPKILFSLSQNDKIRLNGTKKLSTFLSH